MQIGVQGKKRVVPLTFVKVGDDYTAPLMVATVDDATDSDGGEIEVVLQTDPAGSETYTVSAEVRCGYRHGDGD